MVARASPSRDFRVRTWLGRKVIALHSFDDDEALMYLSDVGASKWL